MPNCPRSGAKTIAPTESKRIPRVDPGAGQDDLHLTVKGRRVERTCQTSADKAEGQFDISDERTPQEIAALLESRGFDPVWKDRDEAILAHA